MQGEPVLNALMPNDSRGRNIVTIYPGTERVSDKALLDAGFETGGVLNLRDHWEPLQTVNGMKQALAENGYIDADGLILSKFRDLKDAQKMNLPGASYLQKKQIYDIAQQAKPDVDINMWWLEGQTVTITNGSVVPNVNIRPGILPGTISLHGDGEVKAMTLYKGPNSAYVNLDGNRALLKGMEYEVLESPFFVGRIFTGGGRPWFEDYDWVVPKIGQGGCGYRQRPHG